MVSFKSVEPGVWLAVVSFLRVSSAQCPTSMWGICNPFSETDSSSVSLSLIMFTIQLMVGVPRVTETFNPKAVKMTRAT